MRLTLRTILAYLDDVLEPAQAREIGEKIAESKEATELVARIRDVVRRRRIEVPELAGPGSGPDPNIVSDYLENLLPPAQVVELERLCQASDVHLAEVAACHKILSMVVGHPIDVSDEMRERMYGLGVARAEVDVNGNGTPPVMAEGMSSVRTETDVGLPDYLTRRSFSQKHGALTLVLLLTLFWLGLVWTDSALWTQAPHVADAEFSQPVAPDAPERPAAPEEQPAVKGMPVDPVESQKPQVATTTDGMSEFPPALPGTVPPASLPPQGDPTDVAASLEAAPVLSPPMVGGFPIPPVPVAPEAGDDVPEELPLVFQSGDEFVIKRLARQSEWIVHPIGIPLEVGDELASPVPFRNVYSLSNILDLALEPGTRVRRLPRTKETELGLELNRGQLILSRPLTTTEVVHVDLLAAGQFWRLTLDQPGTRVAVEVQPEAPRYFPRNAVSVPPTGGIAVLSGQIHLSSQGQPELELRPESGYARWPAGGRGLTLHPEQGAPAWAKDEAALTTPAIRQLARLYQKEFIPERTVAQCIGPVVADRRAGISELAVKTLSLIDDHNFLTEALFSDHQESRLAAIHSVRMWLNQNPVQNKELLREELAQSVREESIPVYEKLIWGFSSQDARDPEVSRQMIDWMKDDQVAIRQLAFEFVSSVTGRSYDYLPMAPLSERRSSLSRWEDFLKRNGGVLQVADQTPASPSTTPPASEPAAPQPNPTGTEPPPTPPSPLPPESVNTSSQSNSSD